MTVTELLNRCDSRELAEWAAYESIEPFGEFREDLRMAKICAVMASIWSKGNYKLSDFMFDFEKQQDNSGNVDSKILAFFGALKNGQK